MFGANIKENRFERHRYKNRKIIDRIKMTCDLKFIANNFPKKNLEKKTGAQRELLYLNS